MGMVSHVTPASAGYLRDTIEGTGAIVVGRRVYDYTNGWGGNHPLGVPLFLVTHRPPESWPTPDAPFTAVPKGSPPPSATPRRSRAARPSRWPARASSSRRSTSAWSTRSPSTAPVLLGEGIRFFGELAHSSVLLDDPQVIRAHGSPTCDSGGRDTASR